MRIALSLLALRPGQVGGAETYVRRMVEYLPQVAPGDELVLVVDRDVDGEVEAPGWRKEVVPLSARQVVAQRVLEAYTPWRAAALEARFADLGADVFLFPQQSIFPARVTTPAVLTVVDVQHVFHPENLGPFDRTFRSRVYTRSLRAAAHVLAISEFTRRTLIRACAVAPEKVTAVPLGFTPSDIGGVEPYPIAAPYLYYPAATFPHKGHEQLMRTLSALHARGEFRHRLVLSGARTRHWRRVQRLVRSLGLEEIVEHVGFVSPEKVDALYAGAETVVFPSRYEGFGLPIVEAAHFGKRIVTSRLPVFEEIGVPARLQVDFGNPEEVLAALRDPGPWSLLRRPNTWRETAARSLDVLRSVARSSTPA